MRATCLDGIPILFCPCDYGGHDEDDPHPDEIDGALEQTYPGRVTYTDWPADDYPLRGHMLIVSLSKLEEARPAIEDALGAPLG